MNKFTSIFLQPKQIASLLLFAGICFSISAQTVTPQVVAAYGGFGGSAAGTVSYTLGELSIATRGSVNGIVTQGFQQPEPMGMVSANEPDFIENLALFPNPSAAEVSLSFKSKKTFSATWEILSTEGRQVLTSEKIKVSTGEYVEKIDLSALPAATYFFQLNIAGGRMRTAQLVKL